MSKNTKIKTKKKAREYLIQALYNFFISKEDDEDKFIENFYEHMVPDIKKEEKIFFEAIFKGVLNNLNEIKQIADKYYKGNFDNLNLTEKIVIYGAIYEMINMDEDKKLVISEAMRLSDRFVGELFSRKINAFLDSIKKDDL